MDQGYQWPCNNILENGEKCLAPIRAGKRFCKRCGAPACSPACPKCGAVLDGPEDKFCGECGIKVEGVFQRCSSRESSVVGSTHSGSPAGSIPPSAPGHDAASTVAFSDYVYVNQPYAASDVSMSSSISQKPPYGPSNPQSFVQPGSHQGFIRPPWPAPPQGGPYQPQVLTAEEYHKYAMAMKQYGAPPMMPPHYMMPPARHALTGGMGPAQSQPPFPPEHAQGSVRMPHPFAGYPPMMSYSFPQMPIDTFQNQEAQRVDKSQPESFSSEGSAMDTSSACHPPEAPRCVQGDENDNQGEPSHEGSTDSKTSQNEDSEKTVDPSGVTSPDVLAPTGQSASPSDQEIDDKIPTPHTTIDTSHSQSHTPSSASLPGAGPQSVGGDVGCSSVEHAPSAPADKPQNLQTSEGAEHYTNKNIFGSAQGESYEDVKGNGSSGMAGEMVFGEVNRMGGGDSIVPDAIAPETGGNTTHTNEHGAFYVEQEILRKESQDLIETGKQMGQKLYQPPEAKVPGEHGMKEGQQYIHEEGFDHQTEKDEPGACFIGRRSPKRGSDEELDEGNERFKKLRRVDDPKSDSCNEGMAPEVGQGTADQAPAQENNEKPVTESQGMQSPKSKRESGSEVDDENEGHKSLRREDVPDSDCCNKDAAAEADLNPPGLSSGVVGPHEAPASSITGEVRVCASETSPRKHDAHPDGIDKSQVSGKYLKTHASGTEKLGEMKEEGKIKTLISRFEHSGLEDDSSNDDNKGPKKLPTPGQAGAMYGKPSLKEEPKRGHGMADKQTDVIAENEQTSGTPSRVNPPWQIAAAEGGAGPHVHSQTEDKLLVSEEEPMEVEPPTSGEQRKPDAAYPHATRGKKEEDEVNLLEEPKGLSKDTGAIEVSPGTSSDVDLKHKDPNHQEGEVNLLEEPKGLSKDTGPIKVSPGTSSDVDLKHKDPNYHSPTDTEQGVEYRKPTEAEEFITVENRKKKKVPTATLR